MKLILQGAPNQFLLRLIGIFNRTMRKNFQRQPQTPFLPCLPQASSKKDLLTTVRKISKENESVEQNPGQKFKIQPTYYCLAKPGCLKNMASPFEEVLNRKLLEKERMDIPTQPKTNRPWVANEADMNKLATRTSRLKPIDPKNESRGNLRRISCHYNQSSSRQTSQGATTIDKTTKLQRNINIRSKSLTRDKINSCRIALKKGVFPIDQKKYQHKKMVQYFQQDSVISTIFDKQSLDGEGQFISFDSYKQIDF